MLSELVSIFFPVLLLIAGLIAVLVHLRRRQGRHGGGAALSVVQVLPVGARERVVVLRTRGGRVLCVGVSAHGLQLLTELDEEDAPLAASPPPIAASKQTSVPDGGPPSATEVKAV